MERCYAGRITERRWVGMLGALLSNCVAKAMLEHTDFFFSVKRGAKNTCKPLIIRNVPFVLSIFALFFWLSV
jgi:hypothetical protein